MNYEYIPLANRTRDYLPANPADALISFDLCGEIFWKIIGKGAVARPRGDCRIPRENVSPALDCPYNVSRRAIEEHAARSEAMELDSLSLKEGRSGRVISTSAAREARDFDVGLSNAYVWSVGASSKAIGYDFMHVAMITTKIEVIT